LIQSRTGNPEGRTSREATSDHLGGERRRYCRKPVGEGSSAEYRADENAIKAVINSATDAFNKHDLRAWLRLATADAVLIPLAGR
jgi:hypothetical protein